MKLQVGLLSVLLLSATAFAGHHHKGMEGDWKGGGSWKMEDGTKGKWESTDTITKTTDGMTLKSNLTILHSDGKADETFAEEVTFKHTKNGFFETYKGGNKIGTGYCGMKQCHFESEDNGETSEETVTFHKGNIYKLGSHSSKDFHVVWQGKMKKVKAAKNECKGCATEEKKPESASPTPKS